jgi:heat shock protein HslJ
MWPLRAAVRLQGYPAILPGSARNLFGRWSWGLWGGGRGGGAGSVSGAGEQCAAAAAIPSLPNVFGWSSVLTGMSLNTVTPADTTTLTDRPLRSHVLAARADRGRVTKVAATILAMTASAALLSGCAAAADVAPEHDDRIDGSWMLTSAIDDKGTIPLTDAFISLRLGEGQSESQGACNTYTVSIDGYGDELVVSNLVATERACEIAGLTEVEARYFADLAAVTSGTAAGGQLILKSDTVTLT